jgi:hypothetical protein
MITFYKCAPHFSVRELKRHETKVAEEYCWAITLATGRSCCCRSGSSVLDFGFQLDSLVYTYTFHHVRIQPRLVQTSKLLERKY